MSRHSLKTARSTLTSGARYCGAPLVLYPGGIHVRR